jgi:hypothetical protein
MAAGSITVTTSDIGGGVWKYAVAWTCDASGNVSGTTFDLGRGTIMQAKFAPGSAGVQPTDQYDVTITDADGADILDGFGANLSNATAKSFPNQSGGGEGAAALAFFPGGTVTPVVANAGNAKSGTITLYLKR